MAHIAHITRHLGLDAIDSALERLEEAVQRNAARLAPRRAFYSERIRSASSAEAIRELQREAIEEMRAMIREVRQLNETRAALLDARAQNEGRMWRWRELVEDRKREAGPGAIPGLLVPLPPVAHRGNAL